MSPDKDKALVEKYPEIFRDRRGNMMETAMCWGFEHGDGWYDILDRLCAELMRLAEEDAAAGRERHVPVATQVKEKFGDLRFYVNGATDAQWDAIRKAEQETSVTCEWCGKPGKLRGGGWLYTACDEHTDPEDLNPPEDLP